HVVAGDGREERIGEVEVRIREIGREVVAEAQREVEAVEALLGEHRKVLAPEAAIVEPFLVLDVAREQAHDAAHAIRRPGGRRWSGLRHFTTEAGVPPEGAGRHRTGGEPALNQELAPMHAARMISPCRGSWSPSMVSDTNVTSSRVCCCRISFART